MGYGLIILKKEIDGEEFSNTYAFNGSEGLTGLGEQDLLNAGADVEITGANTSVAGGGIAAFLLHRVVAFDRLLSNTLVNYKELYITDGTRNDQDPGNTFYTAALDFSGLWSNANPVPGNVTLLIQRVPAGFSERKGRLYMRAALGEDEVRLGGDKLVTWQTPGAKLGVVNRVNAAVTTSNLETHFQGDFGGIFPQLVIPHYEEFTLPSGKIGRNLVGGAPIRRFVAFNVAARQVKKGRKEKKSA